MKNLLFVFGLFLFISSCSNKKKTIVDAAFIDSLINNYSPSQTARTTDSNLLFWKKRMDSLPDNYVNGPKYASALISRFRLYGDINALVQADSLIKQSNEANRQQEPEILRTLASLALLQHRFARADSLLQQAISLEGRTVPNVFLEFDISFERGNYQHCKKLLPALEKGNTYGFLFRRSKFEHYDGSLDTSISCMMQAAEQAGNNNYLKQAALSNAADLYIHKGTLEKAYQLYAESLMKDAADFHSIMGIGWIALVNDKNDKLAEKIFRFVQRRHHAPDVLMKMEMIADAKNDSVAQKKWANHFVSMTDQPVYGLMYSKHLVDLYTGILKNPARAVAIAEKEIINRPTPQTYAWYAWALFNNNEKEKAYTIYKNTVSEKPLEGPELYYMGKLMEGLNKKNIAKKFFKAAYKNRYDLSPAKQNYLEKILD